MVGLIVLGMPWQLLRVPLSEVYLDRPRSSRRCSFVASSSAGSSFVISATSCARTQKSSDKMQVMRTMRPCRCGLVFVLLSSETAQGLPLEVRFQQLSVAAELEVWQEAYRIVEEINDCQRHSLVLPAPALMTSYFDILQKVSHSQGSRP